MGIKILAIESSCDDTSAAVCEDGKILANLVAGQAIHSNYGGIVPELASRAHMQHIVAVVDEALRAAGTAKEELSAIAFTRGPGLIGSLMVGTSFAKSMALGLSIPILDVNHMQAHVLAHFIDDPKPSFPFLCLTVSGGHTQIVLVKDTHDMEVIGQTLDDAAGEAFDKSAKILGLEYPGGPLIDRFSKTGNADAFRFAEPKVSGLDFSFSGLKTSVLYFIQKETRKNPQFIRENLNDLCASIQGRIVGMLIKKVGLAAKQLGISEIAIAGGVSANSELRERIKEEGQKKGWKVYIPNFEYCTDNAAMIAITGHYKYLKNDFASQSVEPLARYLF